MPDISLYGKLLSTEAKQKEQDALLADLMEENERLKEIIDIMLGGSEEE